VWNILLVLSQVHNTESLSGLSIVSKFVDLEFPHSYPISVIQIREYTSESAEVDSMRISSMIRRDLESRSNSTFSYRPTGTIR